MCKTNKIKAKIIELGMNISQVAEKMEIDRSTLYRKLSDPYEKFTINEANKLRAVLNLTKEEAMDIFFNEYVA